MKPPTSQPTHRPGHWLRRQLGAMAEFVVVTPILDRTGDTAQLIT